MKSRNQDLWGLTASPLHIQRDLARKRKESGLHLYNPQPFIGPLPAGPKGGSEIPASFAQFKGLLKAWLQNKTTKERIILKKF